MKIKHLFLIAIVPFIFLSYRMVEKSTKFNDDPKTKKHVFHFFVLGDWGRRGTKNQPEVANQMIQLSKQTKPDLIITTGDNFYEEGVTDAHDSHFKESFTDVYKELTSKINWYATLGNHEYEGTGNPQGEIDYHLMNPRWNMPSHYYTFVLQTPDKQKVRFVMIDTSPFEKKAWKNIKMPHIKEQDTTLQKHWIDSTLAAAKEPWKIVVGHHPVFSTGGKHGNTPELIAMLKPMLDRYKVQAYFCGHDHDLEHQKPKGSYVDYFLSGAGSELRPMGMPLAQTKFAESISGFGDVSISGDSLFVKFINKEGKSIYQYARSK